MPRLVDMPGSVRLTAGLFAILILSFALLAQVNLWVQDGGGELPTPDEVLWKYNGKPGSSRLHTVLDTSLPDDHALAMWPYLGLETEVEERRDLILGWVDAGAPEDGWPQVSPILTGAETCGQCHYGDGGSKEDVPFDTYEQVLPYTEGDTGMSKNQLLITAHNHLFGFGVLAVLLSLGLCFTRVKGILRTLLIVGAFAGPFLDIGGWLLTSAVGAPFQYMVIAGGALFGGCTGLMALAILIDALRIRAT